ncbi:UNVERIFIED_CONTAM: Mitochondrial import inner membrane translocase subunit PAM16 like 1 [Sesamum latifolium]|uniref:Mitochondrial import inner membrane translocase subunit PAM16 like 1 n=1 Tax=Sesamum latifolium TaxID=2727402 RepID=A0AAW2YE44_9LAMI
MMTEAEARQILGVTENATWEEILQKYDNLFERNAKNGTFYLQSKSYSWFVSLVSLICCLASCHLMQIFLHLAEGSVQVEDFSECYPLLQTLPVL